MIYVSSNDILFWSPDYCLNWSDFKAESNPATYEDSHSFIKYGFTWIVDSDKLNELANKTMMGRNGEEKDIFGISVFLCSDANSYVTGQTVFLDGGFSAA